MTNPRKKRSTQYEAIIKVAELLADGIEVSLRLQTRTSIRHGISWPVVSWRTRLEPDGKNRKFYFSGDELWAINAATALKLLESLVTKGGLNAEHNDLRRSDYHPSIVASDDTGAVGFFEQITMIDEDWGEDPLFVVLDDPSENWRKIMIVNRQTGLATFRSTTTDIDYKPRKELRLGSSWYLDNSMPDVNVQQAQVFLDHLRTWKPALTERSVLLPLKEVGGGSCLRQVICGDNGHEIVSMEATIFNFFSPTFRYFVRNGKPVDQEILDEKLWNSSEVVYARSDGQEIPYIGKTDGKLRGRIKDHLRLIPKFTKEKDIKYREWAEGKTITIYAYQPDKVECLGLPIAVHVGLEHALIDAIKPWAVARK
jgi:hypothetical protein